MQLKFQNPNTTKSKVNPNQVASSKRQAPRSLEAWGLRLEAVLVVCGFLFTPNIIQSASLEDIPQPQP